MTMDRKTQHKDRNSQEPNVRHKWEANCSVLQYKIEIAPRLLFKVTEFVVAVVFVPILHDPDPTMLSY